MIQPQDTRYPVKLTPFPAWESSDEKEHWYEGRGDGYNATDVQSDECLGSGNEEDYNIRKPIKSRMRGHGLSRCIVFREAIHLPLELLMKTPLSLPKLSACQPPSFFCAFFCIKRESHAYSPLCSCSRGL